MARIPDAEIERLKTDISLVRLVEAAGVALTRHGKDFHGRCPFHDDQTPSLVVSPDKNLWHCLGACNTGGTVIDWTMKLHGVSFRHAVELLREQPSSLAAGAPVKTGTVRKLAGETPFAPEADDARLLERVVAYYHTRLKETPAALDYLKQRGLSDPALIDTFKLGCADRTLAYRLPQKNRAAGETIRSRLQTLGILRESGHEHFNGSLVIPIFDASGNVVQLYGRKLLDNLRAGTPKHLYLPRPHAGIFNRQALLASQEIILCEALIDALTFWCAGFRNVTSAYGVNGFTDELLAAMQAHGTQRVLIAYDRDEAGDKAAAELAPRLMAAGIEAFRIVFPHGLDANAYALKVQPAAKSLGVAIRSAQWLGRGAKPVGVSALESTHPVTSAPAVAVSSLVAQEAAKEKIPALPSQPSPPAPSQASPLPPPPSDGIPIEVREHEILILLGDRRWRVRGFSKEPTPGQLKVNLLVSRGESFHVDTLDLYSARFRTAFVKQAAAELSFPSEDVLKRDLGTVLLKLEALQAEAAARVPASPALTMSAEEKAAALTLLRDPNLTDRLVSDLTACGIVGEDVNKLVAYLACVSRKQEKPLAVVIQSTSAAGKSTLMDAVLALMPAEERVHYSAMTGQSLFYMGEIGVKHKILAIAEEQGVAEAAYALKLLQSQGELTIASTGKDPVSGRLVTHEYKVEGPVMLFLTTTAIEVDEELLNRCLVLTVNESREQTQAIHQLQRSRRTLAGLLAREHKDTLLRTHQNAQRLLRPLPVVNPFAEQLSFVDAAPRTRRDHEKYLSLIEAVTLLHQYQREVKTVQNGERVIEYLEVTAADIALANRLARAVLGQSLDELPPQTRHLLHRLEDLVRERAQAQGCPRAEVRFTRRDVRDFTRWGHTQLRIHLDRLIDMEYLLAHRGSRGASFVYELLYQGEGRDGTPFLPGLMEPDATTTATSRGHEADMAGRWRPQNGAVSGAGPQGSKPCSNSVSEEDDGESGKCTTREAIESVHRSHTPGGISPTHPCGSSPARPSMAGRSAGRSSASP